MSDDEDVISVSSSSMHEEGDEENSNSSDVNVSDDSDGRSENLLELWDVLSGVDAPGTFACGSKLNTILPGLHINGYGDVSFPLRERDAKEIVTLCQRAPFGRGEKTIVDTNVRNTWQLSPSEVKLQNPEFVNQIHSLVANHVAVELGLGPTANVVARLYKLLLYEPGGFFVPHKDTEKEKGMFASLVITLPSTFEGGELIVTHQGMEKKFKPENTTYSASWVAFYADCKHEIKPVTSGYRLALVYNVVSLDKGPLPGPSTNKAIFRAQNCIKKWKKSADPSKAVFVLQHEYTPSGLSVNVLKNKDRAMAQVLQEAIKDQDFDMYLALLNYTKSGGAECEGYYGGYSMIDVADERFDLHSLVGLNGERPDLSVPIDESDVYPADTFSGDPDSESVEEATGNEGASMELRYHRAVIVLWPKECWIDIVCSGDVTDAVKYLSNSMKSCAAGSREWENIKRMATRLVSKVSLNADFLELLLKIGDEKLVQTFLQTVKGSYYGRYEDIFRPFCAVLDKCLTRFGWESLAPSLVPFAQNLSLDGTLIFLTHFTSVKIENKIALDTLKQILKKFMTTIKDKTITLDDICDLAHVANTLGTSFLTDLLQYINRRLSSLDLEYIPLLKNLHNRVPSIAQHEGYIKFAKGTIGALEKRIATAQAREDNWSVLAAYPCKCADCKPVVKFLKSATDREYRYKALQKNRLHVENYLRGFHGLKLSTDTRGSPQTLVVNKTTKESDSAKQGAEKDARTIHALNSILDGTSTKRANKKQKLK